MIRRIGFALGILVAAGLMTSSGCGPKRPPTATVGGRVTYLGKPVPEGRIMFYPDDGRRPAMGVINSDGSYRLTTFDSKDGALLGRHRVTIKAVRVVGGMPVNELGGQPGNLSPSAAQLPTLEWIVPEKYSRPDSSPLKAEVKPGENTINFDI